MNFVLCSISPSFNKDSFFFHVNKPLHAFADIFIYVLFKDTSFEGTITVKLFLEIMR